ncbi:D-alanine--D-alanine ligase [Balneatrix alpica]|uniref:D-alanine--D-alanine ligase n=1 Tax=Balneatrix alpica TaxID=75684 RepID=UPI00273A4D49|nr:D-alanine--D-alanine ligase [Balneatrix alpica]
MEAQQWIEKAGRVAVLYGGRSAEREVSLNSGAAVLTALQRAGFDAFGVDLGGQGQNPLRQLEALEFDSAFIILHGRGGEDGTLQGALQLLDKPYTGSGVGASALAMDKWRTKLVWTQLGLPTPPMQMLNADTDWQALMEQLGAPVVIKPVHEGSSVGLVIAHTAAEAEQAYRQASELDFMVMAEKYIKGREFTVAVLEQQVLPPIWLQPAVSFYDYHAKYISNETRYHFDAGLTEQQNADLKALVWQAYQSIGCQGWGRVDLMQDESGQFWLLEVNTAPGMTDHSLVPMAAREAGISMEQLVTRILASALTR